MHQSVNPLKPLKFRASVGQVYSVYGTGAVKTSQGRGILLETWPVPFKPAKVVANKNILRAVPARGPREATVLNMRW